MNREILKISIPSIVTNITVPLLGMVDVAIVGHIGNASYIAAIALATMVFNLIYWNFGFLRAGTTGLTAQAFGAEDKEEFLNVLVRGLVIAWSAAALLLLLQYPIVVTATMMNGSRLMMPSQVYMVIAVRSARIASIVAFRSTHFHSFLFTRSRFLTILMIRLTAPVYAPIIKNCTQKMMRPIIWHRNSALFDFI